MDDVLDPRRRMREVYPEVELRKGLKVEHRGSRFGGTVAGLEDGRVVVLGRSGQERVFPLSPGGFTVDGRAVTLVKPKPSAVPARPKVTASGSLAVAARARVARGSRILVEGVHDAELVEKVWGDDLRVEGVVVERLDGADHLGAIVRDFGPEPGRRLGVLLDHLVDGSKETRLATEIRHPHVLVTGHPFVDVWQAVKPSVAGIEAWPDVPRGVPWKEGVCAAIGVQDPGGYWKQLLRRVKTYADLEPPLVGAVERLIDFVTEDDPG